MIANFLRIRTMCLAATLGAVALTSTGCKSQDPAVIITVDTNQGLLIPQQADGLRIDIYDATNNMALASHSFTLAAGTNFPFTVTIVDSGAPHTMIKIDATATKTGANAPVAEGVTTVSLQDGATVNAAVLLDDAQ